jgi:hypothetical protein
VDGESVPFAEQRLDRFLGKMTVAGAHINHQRIGGRGHSGHLLTQTLINSLPHQVLHYGTM